MGLRPGIHVRPRRRPLCGSVPGLRVCEAAAGDTTAVPLQLGPGFGAGDAVAFVRGLTPLTMHASFVWLSFAVCVRVCPPAAAAGGPGGPAQAPARVGRGLPYRREWARCGSSGELHRCPLSAENWRGPRAARA